MCLHQSCVSAIPAALSINRIMTTRIKKTTLAATPPAPTAT